MEELLCPHCETELKITASGEPEFASDCYVPCKAICPVCGRKYKLFEVYTFVGYEEMEEI